MSALYFIVQLLILGWIVESFLGALNAGPVIMIAATGLLVLLPLFGTGPLIAVLLNPLTSPDDHARDRLAAIASKHGFTGRFTVHSSPALFALSWASFAGVKEIVVTSALLEKDDELLPALVERELSILRKWDAPSRSALYFYPAFFLAIAGKGYLSGGSSGAAFFPGFLSLILYYPASALASLHSRLTGAGAWRSVRAASEDVRRWESEAALSLASLSAGCFPFSILALRDYLPWDSVFLHRALLASRTLKGSEAERIERALAMMRKVVTPLDAFFSRGLDGRKISWGSLASQLFWNLLPLWCFALGMAGVLAGRLYIAAPFFMLALGHAGKQLLHYPPWRSPHEELPESLREWPVPALLTGEIVYEPPVRGYGLAWVRSGERLYPLQLRRPFDALRPGLPPALATLASDQRLSVKGYFRWRGFPLIEVSEIRGPGRNIVRSWFFRWQIFWSAALAGASLFHMILQRVEMS